jgi:hypothetical protein
VAISIDLFQNSSFAAKTPTLYIENAKKFVTKVLMRQPWEITLEAPSFRRESIHVMKIASY